MKGFRANLERVKDKGADVDIYDSTEVKHTKQTHSERKRGEVETRGSL